MTRALVLIGLLVAGCYDDPDYGPTRFRCDDQHGCPAGQTCINGTCSPGSGGDAGPSDASAGTLGVACGTTICTSGQRCCVEFIGGPSCIAAGATCAGLAATCDGIEDCAGNPCCGNQGGLIECGTSCTNRICLDDGDCPASNSRCCFGTGTGEPWGRCLPACPL